MYNTQQKSKKQLKEESEESDNDVNIKPKKIDCRKKDCYDEATYNEEGETIPRYCKKHKKEGYVLICKSKSNDTYSDNEHSDKKFYAFKLKTNDIKKCDKESDEESDDTQLNTHSDKKFCAISLKADDIKKSKEIHKEIHKKIDEESDEENSLTNAGKLWKKEDETKLLEYIGANKTDSQIGALLGRTNRSIVCKKEQITYQLLDKKTIDEIKKITKFTENEINDIKKRYDAKNTNKKNKTKSENLSITESINLVDKLNELATKNIEHFKLTGKTFVSDKIIESLLGNLKNKN